MDAGQLFGRGMGFPPRVGADGHIQWSVGENNVRDAIRIILMTQFGERINLPDFGGNLNVYLFEPNTLTTRTLIQTQITKALDRWEPRISVEAVIVEVDPVDPQAAIASISYRLVATQISEQVNFNITLGR